MVRCALNKVYHSSMKPLLQEIKVGGINEEKPISGKNYWVECKGYRTLAVADRDGNWSSVCGGRPLPDVQGFYPRDIPGIF